MIITGLRETFKSDDKNNTKQRIILRTGNIEQEIVFTHLQY